MKNQKTSIKGIVGTLIIFGLIGFGIYSFMQPNEKQTEVVQKENKIEPFATINLRQNDLHTPTNYMLDFMAFWWKQEYDGMVTVSNGWNEQRIKDQFKTTILKGYRVLEETRTSKTTSEIVIEYTYNIPEADEKTDMTRSVNATLFLGDDYVKWYVNPFTVL